MTKNNIIQLRSRSLTLTVTVTTEKGYSTWWGWGWVVVLPFTKKQPQPQCCQEQFLGSQGSQESEANGLQVFYPNSIGLHSNTFKEFLMFFKK